MDEILDMLDRAKGSEVLPTVYLGLRNAEDVCGLAAQAIRQLQGDNAALRSGDEIVALESVNNELRGENELLAADNAALRADVERLREALEPFCFFDEEGGDVQHAWEIRYQDRFRDWIDFKDIESARAAFGASSPATPRGPIDWRDGPPPDDLKDGREVLVRDDSPYTDVAWVSHVIRFVGGDWRIADGGARFYGYSGIKGVLCHCPVTP